MNLSGTKFDCHRGTSFSPERRAVQEKAFYDETFKELAEAPSVMLDRLRVKWDLYLARKSRVMSSMITGPARFPTASNEKKIDSEQKSWVELDAYIEKIRSVMKRDQKRQKVEDAGGELAIAKRKAEDERKAIDLMKQANKIVNRKPKGEKTDEKMNQLEGLGFSGLNADQLFVKDFAGRAGFPSYAITNARGRLKGAEERVAKMETIEERSELESEKFTCEGGHVILNHAENRLEIHNDEKPEREIIQGYKGKGFRWSRFKSCWQLPISNQSKWKAEELTGVTFNEENS